MDLLDVLLQIAVVALVTVVYFLLGANSKGWNYPFKKFYAKRVVKKWKSTVVSPMDVSERAESPETGSRLWDSLTFRGTAPDGTLVSLMLRQGEMAAEVAVHLQLSDGTVFRTSEEDEGPIHEVLRSDQWSAGGLKFVMLEPFRRWRLLYNGLLRTSDQRTAHVRLNFIWTTASAPMRHPEDWSAGLAAAALAGPAWRDHSWHAYLEQCSSGAGYEQWGSLQGTARVEGREEVVRARGVRERWWAPRRDGVEPRGEGVARSAALLATARDGNAVYLRLQAHHESEESLEAVSGSVRQCNCHVESVRHTDLRLGQLVGAGGTAGRGAGDIPHTISFVVSGTRSFRVVISPIPDRKTVHRNGLNGLDTVRVPVNIVINGDPGYGVLELGRNTQRRSPPPLRFPQHLSWRPVESLTAAERRRFCFHFTEPPAECPDLVGAKGASLALLTSKVSDEYSVPPGFCVTTLALERQVGEHPALAEAVRDLVRVNADYSEAGQRDACDKVMRLFRETPVAEEVSREICWHLSELRLEAQRAGLMDRVTFAVRSSAIGEDSEELSAAGQNDTVLGCAGDEQVLRGLQLCWASLYSLHSTQYRRMHGQRADTGMGVVVQLVVPAATAGVLFTRHPNDGHPGRVLVTANYGLGESVVSGQVEPDTIILSRHHNDVSVLSIEVGKKTHRIELKDGGDTESVQLSGDQTSECCLTVEQCLRLGKLAVRQEELWGAPRDLEWAIYKERVFLVQARPITSLERWTEFELLHELDSPVMSEEDLHSFANTGEVLPGALSPLTITTLGTSLNKATYSVIKRTPMPEFPSYQPYFVSHCRYGLSLYNTLYSRVGAAIDTGVRVMEMAIHGHEVADERIHAIAAKRNPPSALEKVVSTLFVAKTLFGSKKAVEANKRLVEDYRIDELQTDDMCQLLRHIEGSEEFLAQTALLHNVTTSASVFSQAVAMSVLLEGTEKFELQHITDIGLMLSSCADVVSADVPSALAAVADGVCRSGLHQQFCSLRPDQCLSWLEKNCPEVHREVCQFLKDQAHRNIKEFDLATKTWGLDPTSLLQSIQSAVRAQAESGNEEKEKKVAKSNKEIADSVVTPKRSITRWLLRLVLPLCQRTVSHRESTKYYNILAVHKIRLVCLRLARLMCEAWMLPEHDLIFYFTIKELRKYLETRDPAIIKKASQRQKYYPKWNQFKFPEVIEGHLSPLTTDLSLTANQTGARLKATPVCPGDVVGRVCVITDLAQIGSLQKGDILVTHSTDIGWSPYFPLVGGVVTELGGLISHGAVIAREYGLPCIVGAAGATSFCRTGQRVHLSGSQGVLVILEEATPAAPTAPAAPDTPPAHDGLAA